MKVGIFSDVHNHTDHLSMAMTAMRLEHCQRFLFLGDCTTPETFRIMIALADGHPLDAVPGNNDGDLKILELIAKNSDNARFHPHSQTTLNIDGLRVSLSHYPRYATHAAAHHEADIALHGHTHIAEQYLIHHCLVANPGELQGRTRHLGFAVLDTETRLLALHSLP